MFGNYCHRQCSHTSQSCDLFSNKEGIYASKKTSKCLLCLRNASFLTVMVKKLLIFKVILTNRAHTVDTRINWHMCSILKVLGYRLGFHWKEVVAFFTEVVNLILLLRVRNFLISVSIEKWVNSINIWFITQISFMLWCHEKSDCSSQHNNCNKP